MDQTEQRYEIEYEDDEPTQAVSSHVAPPAQTEQPLGDVYDVYGMVSNVHSKITDMTRDYTLANYESNTINSKFPKFVREQRKTLRVIKSFLTVSREQLETRYTPEYAEKASTRIDDIYMDIQELLLGELDEMVIISRAGKGEIKRGMLLHGRSKEEREEFDEESKPQSKLMEKEK